MDENKCGCKRTAKETQKCQFHQNNDELRWANESAGSQDFDEVSNENLDRD